MFEVLIALAIFSFAVVGLVIGLDSVVKAMMETRARAFSRLALESRLAYNLIDPPLEGERVIRSNGIDFRESLTSVPLLDAQGNQINGVYRLKIHSKYDHDEEEAEILLYRP